MAKELFKTFFTFFLITTFLILLITACQKKQQSAEETPTVRIDSLQRMLTVLNDSVNVTWQEMLASDAQKLRHIDTLLLRIKQSGRYDKSLYSNAVQLRASLAAKRYTRPEDLTSTQIDAYDAATDSLITDALLLYEKLPDASRCVNCEYLKNRIQETDEAVLPYRLRYDRHAEAFNTLLNQNQAVLRQNNPEADTLQPKSLFRLTQ